MPAYTWFLRSKRSAGLRQTFPQSAEGPTSVCFGVHQEAIRRRAGDGSGPIQSLHEHDQSLRAQAPQVNHQAPPPLIVRRRDRRCAPPTRADLYGRRPARRRVPAMSALVEAHPGRIASADLGILPFRTSLDLRGLVRQPVLHRRIVALMGQPCQLLPYRSNRPPNVKLASYRFSYRCPRPQRKGGES